MRWAELSGWTVALVVCWIAGVQSAAAQVGIRVEELAPNAIRIDGQLGDWHGISFGLLGNGDDAALRYALGWDRTGLYVAANVADERMVRTATPGAHEDAIVLTFATPSGRSYRAVDVWLWAGVEGRQRATAGVAPVGGRPTRSASIRIVEGPRRDGPGYVLEALVPWNLIPNASAWQEGRVALRLIDVDSEARPEVESDLATTRVDPRALERLPAVVASGGEAGMLARFLESRDLAGTHPRFDLRGDVAGDSRRERVVVVETYVVVMGEGYRDGEAFDFLELPIATGPDVRSAELRDITGDGKDELLLTLRQTNDLGARHLWQALSFATQRIAPLFGVEVRKEVGGGFVEDTLRVRPGRRGAALVEQIAGRTDGIDPRSYREATATGVQPILLPWGPVLARTFQWDGQHFAVVSERDNPEPYGSGATEPEHATETPVEQRARPRREVVAELVAAYKRRAGVAAEARPTHHFTANLAEGPDPEDLLVFGTTLVVVGPSFRRGQAFFSFQIPVDAPEDVRSVRSADLTGDGRDEVLITIRRTAGDVVRELLLVQQFRPTGFARLLIVEVARSHDGDSVTNEVRVTGRGRETLEIRPGAARGWDASSWPFADGTGDGVEPLLLPWRDRAVRYRYEGGQLVH